MEILGLGILQTLQKNFKVVERICLPINTMQGFLSLQISLLFKAFNFWMVATLPGTRQYLKVVLICLSVMIKESTHFLVQLLAIVPPHLKSSCPVHCLIIVWFVKLDLDRISLPFLFPPLPSPIKSFISAKLWNQSNCSPMDGGMNKESLAYVDPPPLF